MTLKRKFFDEIRRAKKHRVTIIIKALHNSEEPLSITPIIGVIIERNINSYIKTNYNIATLADLPENEVASCVLLIRQYRFLYLGKYYG